MEIFTIGYTKKSAAEFFDLLKLRGIRRVLDIRLHNTSQLAGFSKKDDLAYFLREICACEYVHEPRLSPTEELMAAYQHKAVEAREYERQFRAILRERRPEKWLDRGAFSQTPTVLLCAEPKPDHCHRRLVAEYLQEKWDGVTVTHL